MLEGDIEAWLEANDALLSAAAGVPPDVARHARRASASRSCAGLLLDLLATGDRAGVDAALEVFARGYAGRWWEPQPSGPGTTTSDRAS